MEINRYVIKSFGDGVIKNVLYLFSVCLWVDAHVPYCMCRGQRTTLSVNSVCPSTMQVPETECRWSDVTARTYTPLSHL